MKSTTTLKLGLVFSLALCTSEALSFSDDTLTIWINNDKGHVGLSDLGKEFQEAYGIKVNVQYPESLDTRYPRVASTGGGPDIVIWAHDRFGGWAKSGLLKEITASDDYKSQYFDMGWEAVSYDHKLYGYPISVEALSLIYNKDLVDSPIAEWEQLAAVDKQLKQKGKRAAMWEVPSSFFSWPMISAGGYSLRLDEEGRHFSDVGVNQEEIIEGLSFLKRLVSEDVLSPDMDYQVSESEFAKGNVAYTINGPWSWQNFQDAGINFGVTTLPTLGEHSSNSFVGVLSAGINAASPNEEIAKEFIEEFLLTNHGLRMVNDDKAIGAPMLKSFAQELESDSKVQATLDNALKGELMPNQPIIERFWTVVEAAVDSTLRDKQSVKQALDEAAHQLTTQ